MAMKKDNIQEVDVSEVSGGALKTVKLADGRWVCLPEDFGSFSSENDAKEHARILDKMMHRGPSHHGLHHGMKNCGCPRPPFYNHNKNHDNPNPIFIPKMPDKK